MSQTSEVVSLTLVTIKYCMKKHFNLINISSEVIWMSLADGMCTLFDSGTITCYPLEAVVVGIALIKKNRNENNEINYTVLPSSLDALLKAAGPIVAAGVRPLWLLEGAERDGVRHMQEATAALQKRVA